MLVAIGGSPCEWTKYPNTRNNTMSISSVLSTLILRGRGAKHARCFFKVFGYYVHLLSENIEGLAVHGGNGAVKICGFCFFVVVASGFGGNGDEPKLILWSDVSWYRQRTVSRTSGYGQSPFVAIWRVTETRTRRVSTTVPSHHHTYASIDVCVFCSCSHSIP